MHVSAVTIREARSPADIERAFAIRRCVFVEEQGIDAALEFDARDGQARHLLACVDGAPAGTLRIRLLEGGRVAKIERVAVLAAHRRQRVGHALIADALELVRVQGVLEVRLHAQTAVQAFYAGLGFAAVGNVFEEDGISHIAMRLPLAAVAQAAKVGRR
jgi:predicted GNAT family N-acyltransferase